MARARRWTILGDRGLASELSDTDLILPLWEWHPQDRPLILSERRRRGVAQQDPEPIGDPEYT